MNIDQLYDLFLRNPSIQTDTRKLQPGDLFFALKGDNFNGNLFAKQAIEKGAAFCIVDEAIDKNDDRFIMVDDVLTTLQDLAKYHRQQFSIPFIAITGSNGKTTTKELVHAVLSSHYKTYTTQGNLNNHIGIPLTLLRVRKDAEMAVIEMGANHQKEIESYCQYTLPTHGLITNIGKAHLEGFGGIEGVKKGKGELFDFLRGNNGTAFICSDYDYFAEMSRGIKEIISYGTTNASVEGSVITSEPFLQVKVMKGIERAIIRTQLVGSYNLPNILAAVCIGNHFRVPAEKIISGIENYHPDNNRSQLVKKGNNTIILDAYNANPSSMKLAIENFASMEGENKILVLGGMMELGQESLKEHQQIIDLISKYKWNKVALVGGDFSKLHHPYLNFKNSIEAREWLHQLSPTNCSLLVKGSRSMMMEKVLEEWL